ncbi:hypothetical protein KNJ79_05280 [Sphingopyxis indica]|uniref:hypothetical protein n=1 Tax=Sphingopyxis indica TaxID=436663 RepID=UPI00293929F9|nr:hypothetical protein [Sphingopyxis indica]WOF44345.1 hypothetical protein KNJ79_05280 [Sphingopyxis indica]
MLRVLGIAVVVLGVVVVAAPMPLADPLAIVLRAVGALFVALGVWIYVSPEPEPHDDDFLDFVADHLDAVRDVLADARERLLTQPVDQLGEKLCRHAEVVLASKYHV